MLRSISVGKILFCLISSSLIISCGGGGGDSGGGTTPPISGSTPTPTPDPERNWVLVWEDNFDGSSINMEKWGLSNNCWGNGDSEQQCYTDRSQNAFVEGGVLNIVAFSENFTGPALPEQNAGYPGGSTTLPYTSARLHTRGLVGWSYGKFEFRARFPEGQGTHGAIRLIPSNSPYGSWPAGGEIDVVESVNLKAQVSATDAENSSLVTEGSAENRVYSTLHYGRSNDPKYSGAEYAISGVNPSDDFHTYAIEWEDGEIRWYVDGTHYATQREDGWYTQYMENGEMKDGPMGAPFDDAASFHLVLSLAIGGSWATGVNETGIDAMMPQSMEVDYVRVYKCNYSTASGAGCATEGDNAILVDGHERPFIEGSIFAPLPLYAIFTDSLNTELVTQYYLPENISSQLINEGDRGYILNVSKTNSEGNMYFQIIGGPEDPKDLSHWMSNGELVFDVRVNSNPNDSALWVKMDSGWPSTSDWNVTLPEMGVWSEVRIPITDLINNGNNVPGSEIHKANIAEISIPFVIEPKGVMDVSFDNIRFVAE